MIFPASSEISPLSGVDTRIEVYPEIGVIPGEHEADPLVTFRCSVGGPGRQGHRGGVIRRSPVVGDLRVLLPDPSTTTPPTDRGL